MLTTKPFTAYNVTFPYVYWDDFFSEEELVVIEKYLDNHTLEEAVVTGEANALCVEEKIRITSVSMIESGDNNKNLFDKLLYITDIINGHFYNYDLLGFDHLQYTVYDKVGSHYSYHMDMVLSAAVTGVLQLPRKLSFSLILSNSDEYKGGEFEFLIGGDPLKVEQKRGRIIAFPSYIIHRVTPVTSGTRKSLVFWATGPKFK